MLNLILIIIMFGVKVESCANICECDNLQKRLIVVCDDNTTSHSHLNEDQQNLVSVFGPGNENGVKFSDVFSVEIKTSDLNVNFSDLNLNWLKKVSLSGNNLTTIPGFVVEFTGLDSLDLSKNEIEFVDAELFRTFNLKWLNLSANSIQTINSTSFLNLNNLTSLDFSQNQLTSLKHSMSLPSLQYLNLSNNKLEVLSGAGFNCLSLLQHLDLSWNRLARITSGPIQLPNLIRLYVAGNTQLGKSRDVFVYVGTGRKLQTLDVSRTGLKQVPAALTHSIQSLKLTENFIRTINCGDLESYPLLHSLDLTFNDIKFMEEDSLGRLEFLSELYLSRNQLVDIPRRLPEKLKVLRLDINRITAIKKNDLQGLSVLEALSLNDNNITVINEGAFSELISLVTLDLSRNPLINLQSGVLAGPLSLGILRLSSVAIISTNGDNPFPLNVPERLVTLDLSDSPGLAQQFLSDTATLMAAKRLRELDLSGGNVEYLRQDLQYFLPELKLLRLNGNKLNSTQISWIKSWLCAANKDDASTTEPNIFEGVITKQSKLMKSELTTKDANEVDEFPINEAHYDGVMSEFSQNSLVPSDKNLAAVIGSQVRHNESSADERTVDKVEHSIKWNVSNGEISMYTSEKKNYFYRSLLLVLSTALIVFTITVLLIFRLIRLRQPYVEDIEATALPTISDIW